MTREMFPESGPHDPSTTLTLATATWDIGEPSSASSAQAPSLPELSDWPSNIGCRGVFSLSPTPEDNEDEAKGCDYGAAIKDGCRITLDSSSISAVSLKTAPLTSLETGISARKVRPRFTFSPTSVAGEGVMSDLEEESPSPPSPTSPFVDEREDCPSRESKDSKDDASDDDYEGMHDYVDSQDAFLREKELELASPPSYLDEPGRPGVITAGDRAALLDWLNSLHTIAPTIHRNARKLSQETLFLATNILDRFLSVPEAPGKLLGGGYHLELAATSALCVAAKFEDVEVPSLWDFAAASKLASGGTSYSNLLASCSQKWGEERRAASRCGCGVCEARGQLVRVEGLVMSVLGFRTMAPTALSFLNIYLIRARRLGRLRSPEVTEKLRSEAVETLWGVVRDASSFDYRPSELAATALSLASCNASASMPLWLDLLAITGIDLKQLQGCLRNMRRVKVSAPSRAEEVTPRDSVGGCIGCGTLEHGDGDIRRLEDGSYAGGGPGTLGAEDVCELRGGVSGAGGNEVYAVEKADGFVDNVPRLGGVGSGRGLGGYTSMSGGVRVSEEEVGCGFIDSVLRLGGCETDGGFGAGAPTDSGVEVYEFEMDDGFVDGVLRLAGVEINSGPWGGAPTVGDPEVFEVEVGGAFADSVLRLAGVETGNERGRR